jgi:hypothetical protein
MKTKLAPDRGNKNGTSALRVSHRRDPKYEIGNRNTKTGNEIGKQETEICKQETEISALRTKYLATESKNLAVTHGARSNRWR